METIVKTQNQKKKALFVAALTAAIMMLVFSVTSNVVRAENDTEGSTQAGVDVRAGADVRIRPVGPRPATTSERAENRDERRATFASTSAEVRADIKARMDERRDHVLEAAKERAKAHLARVVKRLEAAVERFEKFTVRIEARIEKLVLMGVDMTKAKDLLAKAKVEIQEADSAVVALKASIEATITADNPREVFVEVKEKIRLAIDAIKEAHAALVMTIREVKAKGGAKADANAENVEAEASVDANASVGQ